MARVYGDIHRALQSYTITYPTPDETLLATPEPLPTSEPATPQIEFTIGPQHVPVVSPEGLNYVLTAILYAAGKNTDAASQTVYYRILKNGVSVATGSYSVSADRFYTWEHYNFYDVKIGDVLACKLWATNVNVNWDYKALVIWPTRIGPENIMIQDISYNVVLQPTLTLGPARPAGADTTRYHYHLDTLAVSFSQSGWLSIGNHVILPKSTYRFIRLESGDYYRFSMCSINTTYKPYYRPKWLVSTFSFRPLNLKL
ncbi:MAG: hypothetical protein AB7U63_20170 [Porticoccaceae bacterium]